MGAHHGRNRHPANVRNLPEIFDRLVKIETKYNPWNLFSSKPDIAPQS